MKIITIFFLFFSLIFLQGQKIEDGYKGIKVFKTSRAEVEKLLGKPTKKDGRKISYETSDAFIRIHYSGETCGDPAYYGKGYNIPQNTVFSYEVNFKKKKYLSELNWDKDSYEVEKDQHMKTQFYYYNGRAGVLVRSKRSDLRNESSEYIINIRWIGTKKQDLKYKCEPK